MYYFLSVLILIISCLLVLIVLVQNSKGGGLTSNFASSNQFMGVRKTADFLEKATWTLAGALLFVCLSATVSLSSKSQTSKSEIENEVKNSVNPGDIPNFQTPPAPSSAKPAAAPIVPKKK
jgi:preprotein translocase subunit SecG